MPQPTTPRCALLAYADHLDAAPPDATWLPPASIAKLIREHAELYPATPDPADAPPLDDDETRDLGDGVRAFWSEDFGFTTLRLETDVAEIDLDRRALDELRRFADRHWPAPADTAQIALADDGPGGHWTTDEWSEWSNELAMLVPEDCPWSNPEGAQEGIILDHFTRLAEIDATRRSLAGVVGAETLDWRAHHVDPGTKDPEDGTEIPAGWYVLATDPDDEPENGHPIVMQVSAVHGGAELDAGEDRSRATAEALVRLLAAEAGTR